MKKSDAPRTSKRGAQALPKRGAQGGGSTLPPELPLWIVGLVALCLVAAVVGCVALTPQQKQTLADLDQQIAATQARLDAYSADILAIKAAIENKEVPIEQGAAVLAKVVANYQADAAQMKDLNAAYQAAKSAGIPWYYIALLGAAGLTGAGSVYFPWLKPAQQIIAALITGVEVAGDARTKQTIAVVASGARVEGKLNAIVESAYPSPSDPLAAPPPAS